MAKILLVEDDNNLREIYEARLQAEGYDIVSAMDGEEALVIAKKEKPDLIISDVMMPRISGFEMLDILRNTDELKAVKIIMLTALGQAEDKSRADSLGADRYLVKSQVTLEDIVKSAQELLGADAPASTPSTAAAAAEIAVPAPVAIPVAVPAPAVAAPTPVAVTPAPIPAPAIAVSTEPPVPAPSPAPAPELPVNTGSTPDTAAPATDSQTAANPSPVVAPVAITPTPDPTVATNAPAPAEAAVVTPTPDPVVFSDTTTPNPIQSAPASQPASAPGQTTVNAPAADVPAAAPVAAEPSPAFTPEAPAQTIPEETEAMNERIADFVGQDENDLAGGQPPVSDVPTGEPAETPPAVAEITTPETPAPNPATPAASVDAPAPASTPTIPAPPTITNVPAPTAEPIPAPTPSVPPQGTTETQADTDMTNVLKNLVGEQVPSIETTASTFNVTATAPTLATPVQEQATVAPSAPELQAIPTTRAFLSSAPTGEVQGPSTVPASQPLPVGPTPPSDDQPQQATPHDTPRAIAPDTGNVAIPGKKVIQPLGPEPGSAPQSNLQDLLAKEGLGLDDEHAPAQGTVFGGNQDGHPHVPGHVISPTDNQGNVDPSSISL